MNRVRCSVRTSRTTPFCRSRTTDVSFRQTVMMCLLVTMMPMGRVEYTTPVSSCSMAGVSTMMRVQPSSLSIREVSSSSRAARRKDGSTARVAATVFSSSSLGLIRFTQQPSVTEFRGVILPSTVL